jgi:two-component system sensor histidine kinase YesM
MFIIIATVAMILIQLFYYVNFIDLSTKKTNQYFTNMIQHVENQLITMDKDITTISGIISSDNTLQKFILEDDSIARYDMSAKLYSLLDTNVWLNDSLESIQIIDYKERIISSTSPRLTVVFNQIINDYDLYYTDYNKPFYTNAYYDSNTKQYYFGYITPIYNKFQYDNKPIGKNILIVSTSFINSTIDLLQISPSSLIFLVDGNDAIIASTDHELKGTHASDFNYGIKSISMSDNSKTVKYNSDDYYIKSIGLLHNNWRIEFLISKSDISSNMLPIVHKGIIITLIFTFIILFFGTRMIFNIVWPISKITSQLENIGDSTFKNQLKVSSNNEIGIIVNDINNMLTRQKAMTKKIFKTQDQLYTLELEKKEAELSALQSQINPHFLYNTLECIRSIGIYHNIDEIQHISTSMAKIFRYAIKSQEQVTIRDEIECIEDYLRIMNIRFMDKFELILHIDESLHTLTINKMVLQPIVENAIYHGLENIIGKGTITINATVDEKSQQLTLEVKDNGKGMELEQLTQLQEKLSSNTTSTITKETQRSVGIINIHNRLKLNYGDEFGINIDSKLGEGTSIYLQIPIIE